MRSPHAPCTVLGAVLALLTACGEPFSATQDAGQPAGSGGTGTTTTSQAANGGTGGQNTAGMGGTGGTGGTGTGGGSSGTKRVFVSSTPFPGGAHPGLAGLDAFCTTAAATATIGGTWIAWASTYENNTAIDASDRISGDGPWILVNGIPLFVDRAQFLVGPTHAINHTEYGSELSVEPIDVWTGSSAAGASPGAGEDCTQWYSSLAGANGLAGRYDSLTTSWTEAGLLDCSQPARVYCFER
jgi:hypothetical protein